MKATKQYFPVVLFIKPYKCVSVTIQTKATEHYFPVVLFIMLRKAVKNRMSVKPLQR